MRCRICVSFMSSFSLFVDERRILEHRIHRYPFPLLEYPEKAALAAGVAGDAADLLHAQQHRVGVAIDAHLEHLLHVPGFFALAPQPGARARPVHRLAALHRLFQRLAVHPGDRKHAVGPLILRDDRHQPVLVPRNFIQPSHSRTSMPRERMCSFAWRTVKSPKWKTDAASTASACPSVTPSARCSSAPTPPEAITGTPTASDTARVSARSKPSRVPSRSMLVSRISPAPAASMRFAHCTASRPVALRPPCVNTCHESPCC